MSTVIKCDRSECNSWQIVHTGPPLSEHSDTSYSVVIPPDDWVEVNHDDASWDFCSLWCCVVALSAIAYPPEEVPS
jgi:hypothetical protein